MRYAAVSVLLCIAVSAAVASLAAAASPQRLQRDFAVFGQENGLAQPVPRVFPMKQDQSSAVNAVASDGRGGWFVGGSWDRIGSSTCANLAHILESGRLDPRFCPRPSGVVYGMVRIGGRLYVGGSFKRIGGAARSFIAALGTGTGDPKNWNPRLNRRIPIEDRGTTIPASVVALKQSGVDLYVQGSFDTASGKRCDGLARIVVSTGKVATCYRGDFERIMEYNANLGGVPIAADDDHLYVQGRSGNVKVLDTRSGRIREWPLPVRGATNTSVEAFALHGSTLYVAGDFTHVGRYVRHSLVALDAASGQVRGWVPRVEGEISAMTIAGSTLFVGGTFNRVGGLRRHGLAAIDLTARRTLPWKPIGPLGGFGFVTSIVPTKDRVAVGCAWCE